tara:strand:- start:1858 stop:2367 length:510 start_codon:yes stop_codon:yes gene_type:complete
MNYNFTNDWTHTRYIDSRFKKRCLEIGAYEGRTTIELADKYEFVDVVDPWKDYWDIPDVSKAYDRFKYNTQNFDNINVYKDKSENVLPKLTEKYDLIYIDGDHKLDSVYNDIKMSCNLLTKDGVIVVDDYGISTHPEVRIAVIRWLEEDNNLYNIHFQSDDRQCCFKFK